MPPSGPAVTFGQLLSLKPSATTTTENVYYFDVQSTRGKWTVGRSWDEFVHLEQSLEGKFQRLPKRDQENKQALSKWLSSLFWLMKGRNVRGSGDRASSSVRRQEANVAKVLTFLMQDEEPVDETPPPPASLTAPKHAPAHTTEPLNEDTEEPCSPPPPSPIRVQQRKKKVVRKGSLRLYKANPGVILTPRTAATLSDLAEASVTTISRGNVRKEVGVVPETDLEDPEPFESVIASIVPQIVAEQVSKIHGLETAKRAAMEEQHQTEMQAAVDNVTDARNRCSLLEEEAERQRLMLAMVQEENKVLKRQMATMSNERHQREEDIQVESRRSLEKIMTLQKSKEAELVTLTVAHEKALSEQAKFARESSQHEEARQRETALRIAAENAAKTMEKEHTRIQETNKMYRHKMHELASQTRNYEMMRERLALGVKKGLISPEALAWLVAKAPTMAPSSDGSGQTRGQASPEVPSTPRVAQNVPLPEGVNCKVMDSSDFRFGDMMEPPPPPPPQSPGPRVLTAGEEETDEEGMVDNSTPSTGSPAETTPAPLFTYPNQSNAEKEQIQQRIAQRKGREESERLRRAQERIDNLKRREEEQQQTDRDLHRYRERAAASVKKWATGKSFIRLLTTIGKVLPNRAPRLLLSLKSTREDMKLAYKKALRAVHPDKVAGAPVHERLKAEQVFKTLREAYARDCAKADDQERKEAARTSSFRRFSRTGQRFQF